MSYCKMPGFANKCGDGTFPDLFCCVSGHRKSVEMPEDDANTLNDAPPADIIKSAGRRCG